MLWKLRSVLACFLDLRQILLYFLYLNYCMSSEQLVACNRGHHCLQTLVLLFKFVRSKTVQSLVSRTNALLFGTLISTGEVGLSITIQYRPRALQHLHTRKLGAIGQISTKNPRKKLACKFLHELLDADFLHANLSVFGD